MQLQLTLLGTGGPKPDPDRQGPAVLVTAGQKKLLFDAGRGVTTRLLQAGVQPQELDGIFITHHHFDHIGNLADLLLCIWNSGRTEPLPVYGSHGTGTIVSALFNQVYQSDIKFRYREAKVTGVPLHDLAKLFPVHDIDQGIIRSDCTYRFTIDCDRVSHGHGLGMTHRDWPCLGYRVSTNNHKLVISGDTVDCSGLERLAKGVDVLVLCCYLAKNEQTEHEKMFLSKHILLSSEQAGKIAARYHVKTLVVTHIRQKTAEALNQMTKDIAADYSGKIIIGKDLLTVECSNTGRQ